MNPNKSLVFLMVILVICLVLSFLTVKVESTVSQSYSVVKILSPADSTYNYRLLTLNVTFTHGPLDYTLTYSLDGKGDYAIPHTVYNPNNELHVMYSAYGSIKLPELSDGTHTITVTLVSHVHYSAGVKPGAPFQPVSPGSSEYQAIWTDSVTFTIDSNQPYNPQPLDDLSPLKISDLSVTNQTYTSQNVSLSFNINGIASQIAYSLDGRSSKRTIPGNLTIPVSVGVHNITVYAWDDFGRACTPETATFSVVEQAVEEEKIEPTNAGAPTVLAASISTVVVIVGLLVYLGYRRINR